VPEAAPAPTRRRGDVHAIAVQQRLDAIERRVDDLLLVARVVMIMLAGHGGLEILEMLVGVAR
jgi:hypothetical protein